MGRTYDPYPALRGRLEAWIVEEVLHPVGVEIPDLSILTWIDSNSKDILLAGTTGDGDVSHGRSSQQYPNGYH